ncbi:hypothetical protein ACFQE8_13225 [Salinirubellus sp. GCM10025818]|uniref:hypothetical protein n=1 Tax=Salinirubellus TaxID=2162630 RepID=UPI0030CECF3F
MSSQHLDGNEPTEIGELPSIATSEGSVFGLGLFESEGRVADLTVLTFLVTLVVLASAFVAMILV